MQRNIYVTLKNRIHILYDKKIVIDRKSNWLERIGIDENESNPLHLDCVQNVDLNQ